MPNQVILICQPLKKIFPDGSKKDHGFSLHLSEPEKELFYQEKNKSRTNPDLQPCGDSYLCVIDQSFYHDNIYELHKENGTFCLSDFCQSWLPPKYKSEQKKEKE